MRPWALVLTVVMLASCGRVPTSETSGSTASTATTSTTAHATSVPTTATTTTTLALPEAHPDIYRFGPDGLFRRTGTDERRLVEHPVIWAADDLMGGVLYRLDWSLDPETTYRLGPDGEVSALADHPGFVALFDGIPAVATLERADDDSVSVIMSGLATDRMTRIKGPFYRADGWSFPSSSGGGVLAGVEGSAVGCGGSDSTIALWDLAGNRLDSPVSEPCGPCELSARLSPDGSKLAYTIRLDAPSEYHRRLDCDDREAWWLETQSITGDLLVIDLSSGTALYRGEVPAQSFVSDFDGRYVVVQEAIGWQAESMATIHDTWGAEGPARVSGGAVLVRPRVAALPTLRGDGLGPATFGDLVDEALARLTEVLGTPEILDRPETFGQATSQFYGGPDSTRLLAVWRHLGLVAAFSDYPFYRDDGLMHFTGWDAVEPAQWDLPPAQTEEGVGPGVTLDEARARLGDRLVDGGGVCGPWVMILPPGDDDVARRISVFADAVILEMAAGASPGC